MALLILVSACSTAGTPSPSPTTSPPPATASPSEGAAEILANGVTTTLAKGTVSLTLSITFLGSTRIPKGTSLSGRGSLSFTGRRQSTMVLDASSLSQGVTSMIIDEPLVWVRFTGPVGALLGVDGRWIKVGATSQGPAAELFRGAISGPNDSSLMLYYLLGAGEDVRVVGPELLDGVAMRRVDATLDLQLAVQRVPATVRDALQANVQEIARQAAGTNVASRTWVDYSGLVRRLQLDYPLGAAQGGGTMEVVVSLARFGQPLDLGIPPDSDVIRIEDLAKVATATAVPAGSCRITTDTPVDGATVRVSQPLRFRGTGFRPGTDIEVTIDGAGPAYTYGGRGFFPNTTTSAYKALHVAADGTFGPWETSADAKDAGLNFLRFSDGSCAVTLRFTVA